MPRSRRESDYARMRWAAAHVALSAAMLFFFGTAFCQTPEKQMQDCGHWLSLMRDVDGLTPDTCVVALSFLAPTYMFDELTSQGTVLFSRSETTIESQPLPDKIRSAFILYDTTESIKETRMMIAILGFDEPYSPTLSALEKFISEQQKYWSSVREAYCYFHPKSQYTDLHWEHQNCFEVPASPSQKELDALWDSDDGFKSGSIAQRYFTIVRGQVCYQVGKQPFVCLVEEMQKRHLRID
jgi:hypothetical protein